MRRWLQSFDFRESPYDRPNQRWVCGRAGDGRPCAAGPDRRGRCRDAARCVPVPSLRARRGRVARRAAVLAVGLLALILGGAGLEAWLSPGPLSRSHASIEACASCHEAAETGVLGWIETAAGRLSGSAPHAGAADGDSGRCLTCHEPGAAPMLAHGLPEQSLRAAAPEAASLAGGGFTPVAFDLAGRVVGLPSGMPERTWACATCHREHEGPGHDLQAMDDAACQSCHLTRFSGFGDGHPEFGSFPFERPPSIRFDHVEHIERHFPESPVADRPARCVDCHRPDERGAGMRLVGFEAGCGACHAGEIRGVSAAGPASLAVVTLPGLDVATLEEQGVGIGAWPALSDRAASPFMALLLSADPEVAAALERFRQLDPLDLRGADEAGLAAVATVAWATKALLHDLLAEGPQHLVARLDDERVRPLDGAMARALVAGLPMAAVREAADAWFPELAREVARHRAGLPVPIPGAEPSAAGQEAEVPAPEGDELPGDELLGDDASSDGGDLLAGQDPGGGEDLLGGDLLSGTDPPSEGDLLSGADPGAGEGDLLLDTPAAAGDLLEGAPETEGDLLGGLAGAGGGDAPADRAEPVVPAIPAEPPEAWAALGGWFEDYFALAYRPADHGDLFLKSWIELAGTLQAEKGAGPAAALLAELSAEGAPGRCLGCHSLRPSGAGGLSPAWQARRPDSQRRGFTRFRHEPHFSPLSDAGCVTCHALDRTAAGAGASDPDEADFRAIEKATCAACHTAQAAGESCLQCHDYHVGSVAQRPLRTPLGDAASAERDGDAAPR